MYVFHPTSSTTPILSIAICPSPILVPLPRAILTPIHNTSKVTSLWSYYHQYSRTFRTLVPSFRALCSCAVLCCVALRVQVGLCAPGAHQVPCGTCGHSACTATHQCALLPFLIFDVPYDVPCDVPYDVPCLLTAHSASTIPAGLYSLVAL